MTMEKIWPDAWRATLIHAYANPKSLYSKRLTPEEGGPGPRQHELYQDAFLRKALGDENALNDVLNVTMALMPDGFHQRLVDRFAPGAFNAEYADDITHDHRARYGFLEISLSDITQPDHLHAGRNGLMGIELKVRSKSSVKQMLHYALLAAREEMLHGCEGRHILITLTPYASLSEATQESIQDAAAAQAAMSAAITEYLTRERLKYVNEEQLRSAASRMTVVHVSFADFVEAIDGELVGSTGPATSTLTKLILGAGKEFSRHAYIARRPF